MNKIEPAEIKLARKKPSLIISVRLLMALILGFCYLINYMQRTNMSIAIICMVNSTAVLELEAPENSTGSGEELNCVEEISNEYSV